MKKVCTGSKSSQGTLSHARQKSRELITPPESPNRCSVRCGCRVQSWKSRSSFLQLLLSRWCCPLPSPFIPLPPSLVSPYVISALLCYWLRIGQRMSRYTGKQNNCNVQPVISVGKTLLENFENRTLFLLGRSCTTCPVWSFVFAYFIELFTFAASLMDQ